MSFLFLKSELNCFSLRACSRALLFCLPSRSRRCSSWVAQFRLQICIEGGIQLSKQCHCEWHPIQPTCSAPKTCRFSIRTAHYLPGTFVCSGDVKEYQAFMQLNTNLPPGAKHQLEYFGRDQEDRLCSSVRYFFHPGAQWTELLVWKDVVFVPQKSSPFS